MLYDSERMWVKDAACKGRPLNYFFTDGSGCEKPGSKAAQLQWDKAKAVCMDCPVLHQCRKATLGEEYGVWGGYDQYQRYQIRQALVKVAKKWPRERRLRWGRELTQLRGTKDKGIRRWQDIQRMTGIPQALAMVLVKEWREHVKAVAAERAEATQEPKPIRRQPQFPDVNGRLDLWVRHNGLVTDGYYKAETPDGKWIKVHVHAGKGHSQKWVLSKDVRFHSRRPRVIEEYVGRPDVLRDDRAQSAA